MFRTLSARLVRRRRARELQRRMRELDWLDRRHGLGAAVPDFGPDPDPAPRRPAAGRARTRASMLLATTLTALLVAFNPTTTGEQLRAMLGIGQDLTFTITDNGGEDGFAFAMMQPGGRAPVTWDPCREIRYVVNPDGAPAGYEDIVAAAVARIADATGLRFVYGGTTNDRRFGDRGGPLDATPPPVLIGWATPEEIPRLDEDVAGVGGAEAAQLTRDGFTYVTGMVALDRDAFAEIGGRENGAELQRAVLTHELGHVVGLDHVEDPGQLMYAETTGRSTLAEGDLEGLAILGDGPCR